MSPSQVAKLNNALILSHKTGNVFYLNQRCGASGAAMCAGGAALAAKAAHIRINYSG